MYSARAPVNFSSGKRPEKAASDERERVALIIVLSSYMVHATGEKTFYGCVTGNPITDPASENRELTQEDLGVAGMTTCDRNKSKWTRGHHFESVIKITLSLFISVHSFQT